MNDHLIIIKGVVEASVGGETFLENGTEVNCEREQRPFPFPRDPQAFKRLLHKAVRHLRGYCTRPSDTEEVTALGPQTLKRLSHWALRH